MPKKIFNNQTLYSAILGANKVKMMPMRPTTLPTLVYMLRRATTVNSSKLLSENGQAGRSFKCRLLPTWSGLNSIKKTLILNQKDEAILEIGK
jgi:hypothetical protein